MSKPYSFIPLLKTKSHSINKNKTSGRINLQIKVLNAIHISMNEYDMEESGILYKKFFRIKEQYAIPGTSIKGMMNDLNVIATTINIKTIVKTVIKFNSSWKVLLIS